MRIGIVTQSYYPRYGGVTEHVHHTAVELRSRGHEVTIITSHFRRGEPHQEQGVERIGHNVLIPFNGAFVDLAIGIRLGSQLRRLYRKHRFDLVHVHAPSVPTLPVLAVRTAPCAKVGTFHMTGNPDVWMNAAAGLVRRDIGKLDARIAVSSTARDFSQLLFPGEYHVVPNGVDLDRFHPSVAPFAEWRDPGILNLLFVGRLDPRKGVHQLIAAFPEIVRLAKTRVRLLIVGDSYLRPQLEAAVAPAVREQVHFLGHVPSEDLPRWYATGDLFVSPASGQESFGIVLVEAMASGRAVVASDIPGYRSVVNPGIDGVVTPPGDVAALARAVAALADDPARRATLARAGRARSLEFSWPRVTDQIEHVYGIALERAAQRGRP